MNCKLLIILTLIFLPGGLSQAADSVAITIYSELTQTVLVPAQDTLYVVDQSGDTVGYQLRINFENDIGLGGFSLGFRIWSSDGAEWRYIAQEGGIGPGGPNTGLAAVTVFPGSRIDPPDTILGLTGLIVIETDVDGIVDDTIVLAGITSDDSVAPGPMEPMAAVHLNVGGVDPGEIKTICFDSAFSPPMANWLYSDLFGLTFPPGIAPAICFPIIYQNPSDIADGRPIVPYTFSLSQNHPNPFNPATVIEYSVARKTHVNIAVYNVLGQTVALLVDEEVDAGRHQVIWDGRAGNGDQAASGVYFYKMSTKDFIETRKMLMMR